MGLAALRPAAMALLGALAAAAAQLDRPQPSWDPAACNPTPMLALVAQLAAAPPPRKRVLVTGAAGFIGSHVAEACSTRLGFEVVAVDDLSGGFMRNVPPSVTFVKVDLQQLAEVEQLFADHGPFDYVYHLAAYAAEGLSHFIRGFNYRNNLQATVQLINQAVLGGVKCFVFTSSIASFGSPKYLPMIEARAASCRYPSPDSLDTHAPLTCRRYRGRRRHNTRRIRMVWPSSRQSWT